MSPETDDAFRQRILQVIDPDLRADAMIATGYGLDGLGSLNGLRRKGLPEESFEDPVVEAFRQVERDMAQPSIVPMAPGERPTEPGWYVAKLAHGAEIIRVRDTYGRLSGWYPDNGGSFVLTRYEFIARIYPDRIEGRKG